MLFPRHIVRENVIPGFAFCVELVVRQHLMQAETYESHDHDGKY
jgi:hypothetical protein